MAPDENDVLATLTKALRSGAVEVVDLTHPLSAETPVLELPSSVAPIPPFKLWEVSRYDERGPWSYKNAYEMGEHVGTHFDAPVHWITGRQGLSVDSVPIKSLIAPVVVIDKAAEAEQDAAYTLTLDDVKRFESSHGPLPPSSWLVFASGWSKRHTSTTRFLNSSVWPGPDVECAEYLAETPIIGFGTETVGIDHGLAASFSPPFPAHHFLLGAGKYGLASLANVDRLPSHGAVMVVSPLRIRDGSGSPMRAFAFIAAQTSS